MKIKSERDKRTYLIIALCAILVIMGVGYAAFSSLLTINGTANISNSWCVGFDNTKTNDLQITKGLSTGTQPTGTMSYSGTACGTNLVPNSSLVAHFYQPGDQIEYTLTITNKSTVTAAIKSILVDNESVTSNTTKNKDNITYIIEMPESTTLAPNASTTMKVIAKFQNDTDVTGAYSGETKTIEVKINAEQDDGNGGMDITPVSNTYTGTIYRWSDTSAKIGDSIVAGSKLKWCAESSQFGNSCDFGYNWDTEQECNQFLTDNSMEATCGQQTFTFEGIGEYKTEAEAPTYSDRVTAFGKNYYLKHDVEEDIITALYVCFVYNNAEQCMKGGDRGASFAANTQIIQDYQTFYSLPNGESPGCSLNSCYGSCVSYCDGGVFDSVSANELGSVYVNYDNNSCGVAYDGSGCTG